MAYIGLDIGTSGCKASIITKEGEVVATASAGYQLKFPRKGYVELDPLEIYDKVKGVLKELAPRAEGVKALALSSFGEAFVLLDEKNTPLYNFITYMDSRCEGLDELVLQKYGAKKYFDIAGVTPNQSYSFFKLMWLKEHQPEIMEKARSIYFANDYYNYLLTGNRGTDNGTASKTLLFDVHQNDWSKELVEECGASREWFSPIVAPGEFLGSLRKELVQELGLPEDLSIYMGAHDQCCATLGGGAYEPGRIVIGEGSTESINMVVDGSIFEASEELIRLKMCLEPFIEPGLYLIPIGIFTFGNSIQWYLRTLEQERKDSLKEGEDIFTYLEAESQKRTNLIFFPRLSKVAHMDPDSKVPGAFIGITLDTQKWEFYRSVIQGLNFESRINLDVLSELGFPVKHVSSTGKITRSSLFMQLKADILKKRIHILENSEAGIMALAMICGVAVGDYKNYQEAVDKLIRIKKVFEPLEDYEDLLEEWKEIRNKLR